MRENKYLRYVYSPGFAPNFKSGSKLFKTALASHHTNCIPPRIEKTKCDTDVSMPNALLLIIFFFFFRFMAVLVCLIFSVLSTIEEYKELNSVLYFMVGNLYNTYIFSVFHCKFDPVLFLTRKFTISFIF